MKNNNHILNINDRIVNRCLNCNSCCLENMNIPLYPTDIIKIKEFTRISVKELLNKYCSYGIHTTTSLPIITLKKHEYCTFSKNGECTLKDSKPDYCRIYPLQRASDNEAGPMHFHKLEYQCNTNNEKCICSVKELIGNPSDSYNLCIEEWYKNFEKLSHGVTGNIKDTYNIISNDNKETIDHIILHIQYRTLDEIKSHDYDTIRYELLKRYNLVEQLVIDVHELIIERTEIDMKRKTNEKVLELFNKKQKVTISKLELDFLITKYVKTNDIKSNNNSYLEKIKARKRPDVNDIIRKAKNLLGD